MAALIEFQQAARLFASQPTRENARTLRKATIFLADSFRLELTGLVEESERALKECDEAVRKRGRIIQDEQSLLDAPVREAAERLYHLLVIQREALIKITGTGYDPRGGFWKDALSAEEFYKQHGATFTYAQASHFSDVARSTFTEMIKRLEAEVEVADHLALKLLLPVDDRVKNIVRNCYYQLCGPMLNKDERLTGF